MRLVSTQNPAHRATFLEALHNGFAPDGGRYVPDPMACFRDISSLLEMRFAARSLEIVHRLLGDEFSLDELEIPVLEALNFPLILTKVGERAFALETFHGPTGSVEDFGARLLAGMVELRQPSGSSRLRTVITATPGASGAAVATAFSEKRGTRVMILLPTGRASGLEARQIAALGGNVVPYQVKGDCDACQALVNGCRTDQALTEALNLYFADSTHIAWLLAYMLLFFEAVAQLRSRGLRDAPVIAVPGGDFGLLYGGLWAKAMGLPVKIFVAATNDNRTVPDFLDSDKYQPKPSVMTLSGNLDITEPTNWERVSHFFGGDLARLREGLRWGSLDDAATRKAMWELHQTGFFPEPHAAVTFGLMEERRAINETGVFIAPIHPAKNHELLARDMNLSLELPKFLQDLPANPPAPKLLANDLAALRTELGHR